MDNKSEFDADKASFFRIHELRVDKNLINEFRKELGLSEIELDFGVEHLKTIHAYIFQDAVSIPAIQTWAGSEPDITPGRFREATVGWAKHRTVNNFEYYIFYAPREVVDAELEQTLAIGVQSLHRAGDNPEIFARKMTQFYGRLDYLHPFEDGNSRALRTYTEQIARSAGYDLDWSIAMSDTEAMKALYIARDKEVAEYMFTTVSEETKKEIKEELGKNKDLFIERLQQGEFDGDETSIALIILYGVYGNATSLYDIIKNSLRPLEMP